MINRTYAHRRLFEISHFPRYDYGQFEVMALQLPALPTHLALLGDYRTREEIFRDMERNRVDLQRERGA